MVVCIKWMCRQYMLHAHFWSTIGYTMMFPTMHKYFMGSIPDNFLAIENIIFSIASIVISSLANKYGDWFLKFYPKWCIIDTLSFGLIIILTATNSITVSTFYLIRIILISCVCRSMGAACNRMKRLVYDGEEREKYDNCLNIVGCSASLIGSSVAMIGIPIWLAWCIFGFSVVIDDIMYMFAWSKITKHIK